MTDGVFFIPGPTEVRRVVLEAMVRPMIPHRSSAFETMVGNIQVGLKTVFGTERPVYITTSSATGLMEAGVRCAPAGNVLSLVNGAFSERFANIAVACGRNVDRYTVPLGATHDVAELESKVAEGKYAVVTVVHSETSTGARNDIQSIVAAVHRHGAICLVDSVSGLGGAELHTDAWELDYVLTGSQKALALPPGLAFAVASERFIATAASAPAKGVYFDLVEHDQAIRKNSVPNTPAISLFYALERQMQDIVAEGMPARWARHRAMAERTWRWADELRATLDPDIGVLAAEGHRSPTVSAITLPSRMTGDAVVKAVGQAGITLGGGYGALKASTFRIGHMGDHTEEGVQRCLDACTEALRSLGA